jgi:hypothetical protein
MFSFCAYGSLLGITAIMWLGPDHAEMKSMLTTGITCAPEPTAALRRSGTTIIQLDHRCVRRGHAGQHFCSGTDQQAEWRSSRRV